MADITLVASSNWQRQDGGAIGEANVSGTTLTLALKPKVIPFGEGNRLARFNIPVKDGSYLQAMGNEALILTFSGELHNTRTKTNSAYADRECLLWAFKNAISLTITLDDGKSFSNMVLANYNFTRIGTVIGGYSYQLEFVQKLS